MKKQRQLRKTSMPLQKGVDRFYYPLSERHTEMAAANRQEIAPGENDFMPLVNSYAPGESSHIPLENDRSLWKNGVASYENGRIPGQNDREFESIFDPNGSYTGTPTDGGIPTQDADDL
jgi:hypothetical protein